MKLRHSVKWMLIGVLSMPGLTACSFGGDEEAADEVEASEDGAAADADANGNTAENAEGNAANSDGNVAFDDNSGNAAATAEGGVASNDIPPELLNSENPAAPAGSENAAMGAEGTAMGNAAMGAEGTAVADASAPVDAAASNVAAPVDAAASAPAAHVEVASGDSRVYYVNADSVAMHKGPSASEQTVGSLAKGDPVLVKIEGAWANVLNRGYVEVASLSQTPVGRPTSSKSWQ